MATAPLVLYPSPGMGHLVSMIELAKLLTKNHNLPVTILIVDPPYNTGPTAPFLARISASNPSISFHRLPPVTSLPSLSSNHEALSFLLLQLSNPSLKSFLSSSRTQTLILDFFCACAIDVARDLSIRCYCFYTSGAGAFASFLNFPTLHERVFPCSFKDLGSKLIEGIPGVPPIPADHMPLPMMDNSDDAYNGFLELVRSLLKYDGIMVNTFSSLETRALAAITAGMCSEDTTPPVYCIGPLITSEGRAQSGSLDCLTWLDGQPKGSAVFLCFGSLGLFSAEQLKEIAVGLERSGQRFLWVVRSPPPKDDPAKKLFEAPPEPDLDALLPEGFLDRTKDQGLVMKSWAPQVEVLKHESIGVFVTHCGWNSVLEAVCAGKPMILWPLYAEQRWNKVFLVEEMRLGVEMRGFESGLVKAEEVEGTVRWLMESEGGRELKGRAVAAKEAATVAMKEGGSSYEALGEVVNELRTLGL